MVSCFWFKASKMGQLVRKQVYMEVKLWGEGVNGSEWGQEKERVSRDSSMALFEAP